MVVSEMAADNDVAITASSAKIGYGVEQVTLTNQQSAWVPAILDQWQWLQV